MEEKDREYEEDRQILVDNYEDQIKNINQRNRALVSSLEEKLNNCNTLLTQSIAERKQKIDEYETKINEIETNYSSLLQVEKEEKEALEKERTMMRGELNAIRVQAGKMTPSEDYTSRERFLELEAQYEAFHEYFKEQWKLTKKQIRKEILWSKNNKKEK